MLQAILILTTLYGQFLSSQGFLVDGHIRQEAKPTEFLRRILYFPFNTPLYLYYIFIQVPLS